MVAEDDGAVDMLALDEPATPAEDVGEIDILALEELATPAEVDVAIDMLALDQLSTFALDKLITVVGVCRSDDVSLITVVFDEVTCPIVCSINKQMTRGFILVLEKFADYL
jgi:anti-anti-sigma regulatory factor